jgi:tRNA dimethylallyltransferase
VLAIFGPTATGKSAIAHAVALEIGGEVVVADPFQRYRGLEVAADAPGDADRREVTYHLVGDLELSEDSTAGAFGARAHAAIEEIATAGRVPIVSGGTGLYLRAALCELQMRPAPDPVVRAWAEDLARHPEAALAELEARDPVAAAAIDRANPRRVVRALERAASGESDGGEDIFAAPYRRPTLLVGVDRPREVLRSLIDARVRREIDDGLRDELARALDRPDLARGPGQVIGMKEMRALRDGGMDDDAFRDALCARTWRLARMQRTWMRRMRVDVPLDLGDRPARDAVAPVVAAWRRARGAVG